MWCHCIVPSVFAELSNLPTTSYSSPAQVSSLSSYSNDNHLHNFLQGTNLQALINVLNRPHPPKSPSPLKPQSSLRPNPRIPCRTPHSYIILTSSTPHSPLLSPQQAEPTSFVPSHPTQMPLSPSPSMRCHISVCQRQASSIRR